MIIIRLSEHETGDLIEALSNHGSTPVLLAYDEVDDAFKVKVDGHWGPPFGTRDDGYGNPPMDFPTLDTADGVPMCKYCNRPLDDGESHLHGE